MSAAGAGAALPVPSRLRKVESSKESGSAAGPPSDRHVTDATSEKQLKVIIRCVWGM